jgi:hypothetical protein
MLLEGNEGCEEEDGAESYQRASETPLRGQEAHESSSQVAAGRGMDWAVITLARFLYFLFYLFIYFGGFSLSHSKVIRLGCWLFTMFTMFTILETASAYNVH